MIQANLIVAAESARFIQPTEGSFYYPALGKNLESFGLIAASDNFQPQFTKGPKLLYPLDQRSQITAIGPDNLQPPIQTNQDFDEPLAASRSCTAAGVIIIAKINPKQSTARWRLLPESFFSASLPR